MWARSQRSAQSSHGRFSTYVPDKRCQAADRFSSIRSRLMAGPVVAVSNVCPAHLPRKGVALQVKEPGGALDVGEGFWPGYLLPLKHLARAECPSGSWLARLLATFGTKGRISFVLTATRHK
ncbi:hypothetical protein ALP22_00211 [Pseudomonas coronafaciens pv. porri]|nr:hypothetical protein ALP22_00211 [Pseudomonas coronafaciens pv. porri]